MDTLTVQVWKLDFSDFKSPAAKLVALALARRSRESGASWARQGTLAHDCGVSKQTVYRCLDELEAVGWLKRVARFRGDGARSSDIIWLTLPETTLSATTVDRKDLKRMREDGDLPDGEDGSMMEIGPDTVEGAPRPARGSPPSTESTLKESLKDSDKKEESAPDGALSQADIDAAVGLIWQRASKVGRTRSSKADIAKALRAALARGHAMERVLKGLGAYFASPDATKDDGAFQKGAHVMLANDRWESFLDDDQARRDAGEVLSPQAQAIADDLGTMEEPTRKRQEVWMQLFAKGMPWDRDRGPEPGRMGCRVDPDIQMAHGCEPYFPDAAPPVASPPPVDDADAAAFD